MSKKFVVIGASAASMAFMTKLRSFDSDSQIMCISGEDQMPYNRCFLADYVSQDTSWAEMLLKPQDFFEKQKIDLRLGAWVTKIDTKNNGVFVGDELIDYDYLFLGIGTRPFVPPVSIESNVSSRVFTFHTAQDINHIVDFIERQKPVHMAVVGAGLNGLECAASLHARGIKVTIIERADQVLPSQVDQDTANYVVKMMQDKGIKLALGVCLSGIQSGSKGSVLLQINTGDALEVDGVVFATGSVLNTALLQGTGIITEQGSIVVDSGMRTTINNIFAGGDICLVPDVVTKKLVRSATWADAMLQGLCAATQFSLQPRLYPGAIGLRDSSWFGFDFYACGQTVGHDEGYQVLTRQNQQALKKLYFKDNVLKGFVLIGDISGVAQYKQWYMTQKITTSNDLLDMVN